MGGLESVSKQIAGDKNGKKNTAKKRQSNQLGKY
jgi:hypothetical protein